MVGAFVAGSLAVGSRSLAMPCPILRLLPSGTFMYGAVDQVFGLAISLRRYNSRSVDVKK